MLTTLKVCIEELKFQFSDGPNEDTIVVTLPCGCTVDVMSKKSGGVRGDNEPFQFRHYCKAHFYGWDKV